MFLRVWRFITLIFATLMLTLTSAHILELPQKLQYDAQMYSAVNTTLYRYFAIIGSFYTVGSIVTAAVLAFLVRKRGQTFKLTVTGAICLLLAFITWLIFVAPVNSDVARALISSPKSLPALWMQLRNRWEYGHAIGFVITFIGVSLLLISILVETPTNTVQTVAERSDWQRRAA
ncbi:MAG: hypothetical protein AB1489_22205 [Acidobacteriota bacterium]